MFVRLKKIINSSSFALLRNLSFCVYAHTGVRTGRKGRCTAQVTAQLGLGFRWGWVRLGTWGTLSLVKQEAWKSESQGAFSLPTSCSLNGGIGVGLLAALSPEIWSMGSGEFGERAGWGAEQTRLGPTGCLRQCRTLSWATRGWLRL